MKDKQGKGGEYSQIKENSMSTKQINIKTQENKRIITFSQLIRQSFMKYSDAPLDAQFSLVKPGCVLLSRKRILSRNSPRSSGERAAIILQKYKHRI